MDELFFFVTKLSNPALRVFPYKKKAIKSLFYLEMGGGYFKIFLFYLKFVDRGLVF